MAEPRRHNTEIEWTHPPGFLGETWNPTTGCEKVSPACANCYAELMNQRFGLSPPFTPKEYRVDLHPDRLQNPMRWLQPRCIFVDSMADLFHKDVPFDFIDKVMAVVMLCQQHIFQVLTKRPEIMLEYFDSNPLPRIKKAVYEFQGVGTRPPSRPWSERIKDMMSGEIDWPFKNLWLGVSTENQYWANERVSKLLRIAAVVHFVSAEPLLGPIDYAKIPLSDEDLGELFPIGYEVDDNMLNAFIGATDDFGGITRLDWVITGGESGPKVRLSHPQWFRDLRDACIDWKVRFFMKRWGSWGVVQEAAPMEIVRPLAEGKELLFSKTENGFKYHKRLAGQEKAQCGYKPKPPSESEDTPKRSRWVFNKVTMALDPNLMCTSCLAIGKPTIKYARLDPRDRNRESNKVLRETDVPMMRMGKLIAGAKLDGVEWKQFPDLSHFTVAAGMAVNQVASIVLTKMKCGCCYHARNQMDDSPDFNSLCGFYPGKSRTSQKYMTGWLEDSSIPLTVENKDSLNICLKCVQKLRATKHEIFNSVAKVLS